MQGAPGFKREWGHEMANLIGNIAFWRRVPGPTQLLILLSISFGLSSLPDMDFFFTRIQGIHTGVESMANTHDGI